MQAQKSSSKTIQATHLFLTLAQSAIPTVQNVYDAILAQETKGLEHLAVVCETHTKDLNKGKHYHVYLKWFKNREISLRHFDYLQSGVHVEKVKNRQCLLAYITKENKPQANFDFWRELLKKRSTFPATLDSMVNLYGYDIRDIQDRYSTELSDKPWSTVRKFVLEVSELRLQRQELFKPLRFIDRQLIETRLTAQQLQQFDANPLFPQLIDHVNNLKKYGSKHPHKSCTVALVGGPSIGKTTFLNALSAYYPTYSFPDDGWHRPSYRNDFYSMWIWNEWSLSISNLSWEDFLLLTEGLTVDLRVKGHKTKKSDRPMLFLTSNDTLEQQIDRRYRYLLYTTPIVFHRRHKAAKTRIVEFDFGDQPLFFLQNLLVKTTEDINPQLTPRVVE